MPEPMWDQNRKLTSLRVKRAIAAYNLAKQHIDVPAALRFAGYVTSHRPNPSIRMADPYTPGQPIRQATDEERVNHYWNAASKTGHRYAKGIHGNNYEVAGRRLIAEGIRQLHPNRPEHVNHLLSAFEQGVDNAHIPLLDALQENDMHEGHELLARPSTDANPGRLARIARYRRKVQL